MQTLQFALHLQAGTLDTLAHLCTGIAGTVSTLVRWYFTLVHWYIDV